MLIGSLLTVKAQMLSDSIANYGIEKKCPATTYTWDWSSGVFLNSLVQKYRSASLDDKGLYLNYIKTAMDTMYRFANGRTPNAVISGLGMAFLAQTSKDGKYYSKAKDIYNDYLHIVRAYNEGVSHRSNTIELWDDTIYMIGMYLFEMYRLTGDKKYLDNFMKQYNIHKAKLNDKKWNLWVHGWDADNQNYNDSCCMIGWADNSLRRSNEFWGRGNGWILMTIADALQTFPKSSSNWEELKKDLIKMTAHLPELQNNETGHWSQLPIYPQDSLNFEESSCTAMFSYAMLIGMKLKILNNQIFKPVVDRAYFGLRKYSIRKDNNKSLIPYRVCEGTCIGNKAYYYNRKTTDAPAFGVGIFVMFSLQYEQFNIGKN